MMMKSTMSARTVSVRGSRGSLVVVNSQAGRKTVGGRKTGASIAEERTAYLKTLPGVTAPFEDVFDPANLSATASIEDIRRWRESEITHGRVSMLAAVGFIVGENVQDNQFLYNFDGKVEGPAITHWNQLGQGFWEPLLIFIGLAETYRVNVGWATPTSEGFNLLKDDYEMGNLGFDPLGVCPTDPEERKDMQSKELNNGRLAMIAIAGFVLQEVAEPGVEIFEHLFYNIEVEAVKEIDDIERAVGLPITPLP